MSLFEIVVVAAILVLLAAVLAPVVSTQVDDARGSRATDDMAVIAKAFTTFRAHTSHWPYSAITPVPPKEMTSGYDEFVDFRCLFANAQSLTGWRGPYLTQGITVGGMKRVARAPSLKSAGDGLLDPWGQPYRIYRVAPTGTLAGMIAVLSRGPDGVVNSSGDDVSAGAASGDDIIRVVSRRL
jgi:general secretion pathway protein G